MRTVRLRAEYDLRSAVPTARTQPIIGIRHRGIYAPHPIAITSQPHILHIL